ncbi:LLM class flavin-dependent oxidoreductase [Novosphingobium sp. CECT 9465]|uniref:LLM class flavin-dependent oxidoreductase n=1 Tax=Novosphingobium sp. CECT 9465 TaxID=2829794 RepID=UPI001E3639FB|nr:LLM class flavin-dependent oxidoreductase [Novosphingobium sp. CECT 9465]CAH0495296.1 Alkanal monooxygenase alpha chain [Novosphingobium sp. CECT 9465]
MKVSYLCMTGYDGPAPGIEIWPASPEFCEPAVAQGSYARYLEMAETAEALGFDWVSVSEHHYAPYQMTPNPMIMASAIIQRTRRVRVALLGPLVPLNNPVRLAEEVAMLDALSGGRLEVLFLRGTPNEHKTYDTQADQTKAMTQEGIDLILKAWTSEKPFGWEGDQYQFNTISIWPRITQLPHPPVFGSGNSEDSVVFAARRRIGIAFSFAAPETVKGWIELYRAECAKEGWEPTPAHVIYRGIAYCAPTDEQAQSDMIAYFGAQAEAQGTLQSATLGGPPVLELVAKPYFVGSPETLIEKFRVLHDIGVGVCDLPFVIGTPDQQRASLDLFGRKVLPTVQSWDMAHFPQIAQTEPAE